MRRGIVAGSVVCLLLVTGCGPSIQQNMRKTSLGVLQSLGALQDLEKLTWDSQQGTPEAAWAISRPMHRTFNARMEALLIVGQEFNKTAWLFPSTTVGLDHARSMIVLLEKMTTDMTDGMPDGSKKTALLIAVQSARTAVETAVAIMKERQ